jgi:hypothetical protein
VLAAPEILWTTITVPHWYGEPERVVEIISDTAVWYHTGLPPVPIRWVLVRDPLGKFEPRALRCTDLEVAPQQVLAWFMLRWRVEVTFQEARAHLGLETQPQWSDLAIARALPRPCWDCSRWLPCWPTGWVLRKGCRYARPRGTRKRSLPSLMLWDALAEVRKSLWSQAHFPMSPSQTEIVKIPKPLFDRLTEALRYAV